MAESMDDERNESEYDSFKIISKKALADYRKAEKIFLDFLEDADVWSQEEVTAKIIDFHLVEKCRTKFRAFVRSYGAKVKFDPVESAPRKQEYHGTVTVTRACKQQYLTTIPKVLHPAKGQAPAGETSGAEEPKKVILQCAAPTPITTGGQHIPYSPDDVWDSQTVTARLPPAMQEYLSPRQAFRGQPSPRDTTTGAPPLRGASAPVPEGLPILQPGDMERKPEVAQLRGADGDISGSARVDAEGVQSHALRAWMDPLAQQRHSHSGAQDQQEPSLMRSATFPSQTPTFSAPASDRSKRFSLQDIFTHGHPRPRTVPEGAPITGRQRATSISACGEGFSRDATHRLAGAGPFGSGRDGPPNPQAWPFNRRTSAPVGAGPPRRSDGFAGVSGDLSGQRLLAVAGECPEGPPEAYDWLSVLRPHTSGGTSANLSGNHRPPPQTDASPRKSPRIAFASSAVPMTTLHAPDDLPPGAGLPAGPSAPTASSALFQPPEAPNAADFSVAAAIVPGAHGHLSGGPGMPTLGSKPGPGTPQDASVLLGPMHPGCEDSLESLRQLLSPEVAPWVRQGAPAPLQGDFSVQQRGAAPLRGAPVDTRGAPAQAAQSGMEVGGSAASGGLLQAAADGTASTSRGEYGRTGSQARAGGVAESRMPTDGLCSTSYSIRSGSSAPVSLSDVQLQPAGSGDCLAEAFDATASECGHGTPNPSSPPRIAALCGIPMEGMSVESLRGTSWAPSKRSRSHSASCMPPVGAPAQRRQSSNATMPAYHDEGPGRLMVRVSDTSGGASTDIPGGVWPELDNYAHMREPSLGPPRKRTSL